MSCQFGGFVLQGEKKAVLRCENKSIGGYTTPPFTIPISPPLPHKPTPIHPPGMICRPQIGKWKGNSSQLVVLKRILPYGCNAVVDGNTGQLVVTKRILPYDPNLLPRVVLGLLQIP